MHWQTTRFRLSMDRPLVMGIVNVTPDSFSDGGRFADADAAKRHCDQLVEEGADILDIGGESTRPGARRPDLTEELDRVLPVLRHAVSLGLPVSVDTSQPEVMRAAIDLGVDIVNDVRALHQPGALAVLAQSPGTGICLMHMRGEPGSMQQNTHYEDAVLEVRDFLEARLRELLVAGIVSDRVVLDPGVGFGKSPTHNWALLQRQSTLLTLGRPLLVGWSRKSTLGALTGRPIEQRMVASVAATLAAVQRGAHIVRVHDVAETVDALKVWQAAHLPG